MHIETLLLFFCTEVRNMLFALLCWSLIFWMQNTSRDYWNDHKSTSIIGKSINPPLVCWHPRVCKYHITEKQYFHWQIIIYLIMESHVQRMVMHKNISLIYTTWFSLNLIVVLHFIRFVFIITYLSFYNALVMYTQMPNVISFLEIKWRLEWKFEILRKNGELWLIVDFNEFFEDVRLYQYCWICYLL